MYAIAIVAERDIPAKQCTNTRPFDAFAFSAYQRNQQHYIMMKTLQGKQCYLEIVQNFQKMAANYRFHGSFEQQLFLFSIAAFGIEKTRDYTEEMHCSYSMLHLL